MAVAAAATAAAKTQQGVGQNGADGKNGAERGLNATETVAAAEAAATAAAAAIGARLRWVVLPSLRGKPRRSVGGEGKREREEKGVREGRP